MLYFPKISVGGTLKKKEAGGGGGGGRGGAKQRQKLKGFLSQEGEGVLVCANVS